MKGDPHPLFLGPRKVFLPAAVFLLAACSLSRTGKEAGEPGGNPSGGRVREAGWTLPLKWVDYRESLLGLSGRGGRVLSLNPREGKAFWPWAGGTRRLTFLARGKGVFLDLDGDGRLGKGDQVLREGRNLLRAPVSFAGKRISYPFVAYMKPGVSISLRLEPARALECRWRGFRIQVLDENLDGRFFQCGKDALLVEREGKKGGGEPSYFLGKEPFPFSRVLSLEERLFSLRDVEGGKALRITPYRGKAGLLALEGDGKAGGARVVLADPVRGNYLLLLGPGRFLVPVGEYWIQDLKIALSSSMGDAPRKKLEDLREKRNVGSWDFLFALLCRPLVLPGCTRSDQVRVKVGEKGGRLDLSLPSRLDFRVSTAGNRARRLVIRDVRLENRGGLRFKPAVWMISGKTFLDFFFFRGGRKIPLDVEWRDRWRLGEALLPAAAGGTRGGVVLGECFVVGLDEFSGKAEIQAEPVLRREGKKS